MEFGLTEALPIYSKGLGILAGDHMKSASDLNVPLVGIGLLYQQGYFRQVLANNGRQLEAFPFNDPSSLPITPVLDPDGRWPRIRLDLPGRTLFLRVWRAQVGKVRLYLLDSNHPLNSPWDRGITANLYAAGKEERLLQEIVLGIGGWRLLEKLGIQVQVCHLNEGHAAFAVLARASSFASQHGVSFDVALRATRAGNVFTTHTPVEAAFERETGLTRDQFSAAAVTPTAWRGCTGGSAGPCFTTSFPAGQWRKCRSATSPTEFMSPLGGLSPNCVQVQMYADPVDGGLQVCVPMQREGKMHGVVNGHIYRAAVPAGRPAEHYTARIVPYHPEAFIPMECTRTIWQR